MNILNKIALFFVVFYSVVILLNTYLGEYDRTKTNVMLFFMNGFAYIVSAMEVENEKNMADNTIDL